MSRDRFGVNYSPVQIDHYLDRHDFLLVDLIEIPNLWTRNAERLFVDDTDIKAFGERIEIKDNLADKI